MANHLNCSFCGRSDRDAGLMMETTDRKLRNRIIRICRECALLAIETIDAETARREPPEAIQ